MKRKFLIIVVITILILTSGGTIYLVKPFKNTVVVAPNPDIKNTLTLILSPHFDDGVLSLGGLIAKQKNQILVTTFFTKRPTVVEHTNWDKISGFSNSDEAMFARIKENEEALIPLGAEIKNYDYPDFQYRSKNEDIEIKKEISKNISDIIDTYLNREIFIYGPATFGSQITHPDHQIVHDALMDVWKKTKKTNVHFAIYEDFPYVENFALSNQGDLNTYLEQKEGVKFSESLIELNKVELSEKINTIDKYKSQVKAFMSFGENLGMLDKQFFQKRCKILSPLMYGCEVVHI